MSDNELDVRPLRKSDKPPAIFAAYGGLPVGRSFVLVDNHDPKHLHEEFEADHAGSYDWQYVEKGPTAWRIRISKLSTTPPPRVLANTSNMADAEVQPDEAGVVWKLEARERDLDSNVIALAPNGGIDAHNGAKVDVLIHVLSGSGQLITELGDIDLTPGVLLWLPRRSRRQFAAGRHGLRYLTVHQKRRILSPTPAVPQAF
jgi:uncharacterized protein (DUF2249 family)